MSLPVLILSVELALPTHSFLDGVMVTLYSVPHFSELRSHPMFVPLQLCISPAASTAVTECTNPVTLVLQVIDATPVAQSMTGRKEERGQGAKTKKRIKVKNETLKS